MSLYDPLFSFLKETDRKIKDYLEKSPWKQYFLPEEIKESTLLYPFQPAKRLRPSVLLLCCGAVGGNQEAALPLAVGVELFHTWTLVHDDLMDNDPKRRGAPSVHYYGAELARDRLRFPQEKAKKYGADLAILVGDLQHGWQIAIMAESATYEGVEPRVVLYLIQKLEGWVLSHLIAGQALDIQYSLRSQEQFFELTDQEILHMLWLKTGALYEYCGLAGALFGKNSTDENLEEVKALANFTSLVGKAFQLQDDLLGLLGDEEKLGKPVGSDIREGKKTLIVYYALQEASEKEKKKIFSLLGNPTATPEEIQEVIQMLIDLGGVEKTKKLAEDLLKQALCELEKLPSSQQKELLSLWADYMIHREL